MVQIPEEIRTAIKNCGTNGMKAGEIIKFVKERFQRHISGSTVYYILHPEKKTARSEKAKSRYQRHTSKRSRDIGGSAGTDDPTDIDAVIKDIHNLVDELKKIYLEKFLRVRRNLIAAVAELKEAEEE